MGEPRRHALANFVTLTSARNQAGPHSRDTRPAQDFDNGGMTTPRLTSPRTGSAPKALARLSPQQLVGRRDRLQRELAQAFGVHPLPAALIERLVEETAATEREIGALRAVTA